MKLGKILAVLVAAALLFGVIAPQIFADDFDTSSGSAGVGNAVPTITNPMLTTQDGGTDKNNSALTVFTEFWANLTAGDDNTLNDFKNVTWILYDSATAQPTSADSATDHYTFQYDNATDSFDEVGPDAGDSHLVSANCSDPADHSATSGEYKLAFKLAKTAAYASSATWKVQMMIYDGTDALENVTSLLFSMSFGLELTITDGSHSWSSLSPDSTENLISSPVDNDIDFTVTANAAYDVEAKGSGALASGGDTIPLSNVKVHQTTYASALSLTTDYQDSDILNQAAGADNAQALKVWLDVPAGTPVGTYTYTLYLQGTKH